MPRCPLDIIKKVLGMHAQVVTKPSVATSGQLTICNAVRSNLYRWTSQHDANVVRKHQDIVKNVTGFPKVSRHLLKRQGKN